MDKYQKMRVLGKGSFGSAILIKRKTDGALFVVKEIGLLKMSKKEREEARHECTVLQQLQHPNIVRYIEQFENRNNLYIVMEYCDGGDLGGKVKESRGPMKESTIMYYFSQVCLAMEYLHARHILHRDIKTMNVFLMKNGAVKLGDFGISTVLRNTMGMANTVCGTPYYFSPELCRNKPYNNKSDIWALGVLLYETATGGRHPFDGNSMNQLMQRIVRGSYPPLSSQYSADFRKMVDWCLQKDPMRRPSIKQTLALPVVRRALEQLEENLMLATQCRVRLKDIIDFEAVMDRETPRQDAAAQKEAAAVSKPLPLPANDGVSPGQAAALAMAKQRPVSPARGQAKPLTPASGAAVGPKPSAKPVFNSQALLINRNSPYQPQPQHPPAQPNRNRYAVLKLDKAAQPPPLATPAGRKPPGGDGRAGNDLRSNAGSDDGPIARNGAADPYREDVKRVNAIIARYGQNVDSKAKETIHAYMRRRQEQYMQRQKEELERRERRNELRQRELKRVLNEQRYALNPNVRNGDRVPQQKNVGASPSSSPRKASAAPIGPRPQSPGGSPNVRRSAPHSPSGQLPQQQLFGRDPRAAAASPPVDLKNRPASRHAAELGPKPTASPQPRKVAVAANSPRVLADERGKPADGHQRGPPAPSGTPISGKAVEQPAPGYRPSPAKMEFNAADFRRNDAAAPVKPLALQGVGGNRVQLHAPPRVMTPPEHRQKPSAVSPSRRAGTKEVAPRSADGDARSADRQRRGGDRGPPRNISPRALGQPRRVPSPSAAPRSPLPPREVDAVGARGMAGSPLFERVSPHLKGSPRQGQPPPPLTGVSRSPLQHLSRPTTSESARAATPSSRALLGPPTPQRPVGPLPPVQHTPSAAPSNAATPAAGDAKKPHQREVRKASRLSNPELIDVPRGISRAVPTAQGEVAAQKQRNLTPLQEAQRVLRRRQLYANPSNAVPSPPALTPSAEVETREPEAIGYDLQKLFIAADSISPAHPRRRHPLSDGDTVLYAAMAHEATSESDLQYLRVNRRGVPEYSSVPSMLDTLRGLRHDGGPASEGGANAHDADPLALLRQRQGHRGDSPVARPSTTASESRPTSRRNPRSEAVRTPSVSKVAPNSPVNAPSLRNLGRERSPTPPTQSPPKEPADRLHPSNDRRVSMDGYAEMLQHLKNLLQKRKSYSEYLNRPSTDAGRPAATPALSTPPAPSSQDNGEHLHDSAPRSPPALTFTRPLLPAARPNEHEPPEANNEDDFEDAVPLSPVRHAELNDTYARMLQQANKIGDNVFSRGDSPVSKPVYTNDAFLSGGDEKEEDGEEGYTGHYHLPEVAVDDRINRFSNLLVSDSDADSSDSEVIQRREHRSHEDLAKLEPNAAAEPREVNTDSVSKASPGAPGTKSSRQASAKNMASAPPESEGSIHNNDQNPSGAVRKDSRPSSARNTAAVAAPTDPSKRDSPSMKGVSSRPPSARERVVPDEDGEENQNDGGTATSLSFRFAPTPATSKNMTADRQTINFSIHSSSPRNGSPKTHPIPMFSLNADGHTHTERDDASISFRTQSGRDSTIRSVRSGRTASAAAHAQRTSSPQKEISFVLEDDEGTQQDAEQQQQQQPPPAVPVVRRQAGEGPSHGSIRPSRTDSTVAPPHAGAETAPPSHGPPNRVSSRARRAASSRAASRSATPRTPGDGRQEEEAPQVPSRTATPRAAAHASETPLPAAAHPLIPTNEMTSPRVQTADTISFHLSNTESTPRSPTTRSQERRRPVIPTPDQLRTPSEYTYDGDGMQVPKLHSVVHRTLMPEGRAAWMFVDPNSHLSREIGAPPLKLSRRAQAIMLAKRRSVEKGVQQRRAAKMETGAQRQHHPNRRLAYPAVCFFSDKYIQRHVSHAANSGDVAWGLYTYDASSACTEIRAKQQSRDTVNARWQTEQIVRALQPIQVERGATSSSPTPCACVTYEERDHASATALGDLISSRAAMEEGFRRFLTLQPMQLANVEVAESGDRSVGSQSRRPSVSTQGVDSFLRAKAARGVATLGGLWCSVEAIKEDGRSALRGKTKPPRRVMRICGGQALGLPLQGGSGKALDVRCYELFLFPQESSSPSAVNYGSEGLTLGQLISPPASTFPLTPRIVDDPIALKELKRKMLSTKSRQCVLENNEDDRLTFIGGDGVTDGPVRTPAAPRFLTITLVTINPKQRFTIDLTLVMLPFRTNRKDGGKTLAEVVRFCPTTVAKNRRLQGVSLSFSTKTAFYSAYKALLWATECNIIDVQPTEHASQSFVPYVNLRVSATPSPLAPWSSSFGTVNAEVAKENTFRGNCLEFAVTVLSAFPPQIQREESTAREPLTLEDFVIVEPEPLDAEESNTQLEGQDPAAATAARSRRRSSIFTSTITPRTASHPDGGEGAVDSNSATTVVGLTPFGVVRRAVHQKTSEVFDCRVIPRNRARVVPLFTALADLPKSSKEEEEHLLQQDVEAAIMLEYASRLPFHSRVYGVLVDEQRYYIFQEPWISALALEQSAQGTVGRDAVDFNPMLKAISDRTAVMSLKDFMHAILHPTLLGRGSSLSIETPRFQIARLLLSQFLLLLVSIHGKGMLLGPCPPQRILVRIETPDDVDVEHADNLAKRASSYDAPTSANIGRSSNHTNTEAKAQGPISCKNIQLFVPDLGVNTSAWSYERQQCGVLEYLSPSYIFEFMLGNDISVETRPWTIRDDWWTFLCVYFELFAGDGSALVKPKQELREPTPTPTLSKFSSPVDILDIWDEVLCTSGRETPAERDVPPSSTADVIASRVRQYVHRRVLKSVSPLVDGWVSMLGTELEVLGSTSPQRRKLRGGRAVPREGASQSGMIGVSLAATYLKNNGNGNRELSSLSSVSIEFEDADASNIKEGSNTLEEMAWMFEYRSLFDTILDVVFPGSCGDELSCAVHGPSLLTVSHPFFADINLGEVFDGTATLKPSASLFFRRELHKSRVQEMLVTYRTRAFRGPISNRPERPLMISGSAFNTAGTGIQAPLLLLSSPAFNDDAREQSEDHEGNYFNTAFSEMNNRQEGLVSSRSNSYVGFPSGSPSPRSVSPSAAAAAAAAATAGGGVGADASPPSRAAPQNRLQSLYKTDELQSIAALENEVRSALYSHAALGSSTSPRAYGVFSLPRGADEVRSTSRQPSEHHSGERGSVRSHHRKRASSTSSCRRDPQEYQVVSDGDVPLPGSTPRSESGSYVIPVPEPVRRMSESRHGSSRSSRRTSVDAGERISRRSSRHSVRPHRSLSLNAGAEESDVHSRQWSQSAVHLRSTRSSSHRSHSERRGRTSRHSARQADAEVNMIERSLNDLAMPTPTRSSRHSSVQGDLPATPLLEPTRQPRSRRTVSSHHSSPRSTRSNPWPAEFLETATLKKKGQPMMLSDPLVGGPARRMDDRASDRRPSSQRNASTDPRALRASTVVEAEEPRSNTLIDSEDDESVTLVASDEDEGVLPNPARASGVDPSSTYRSKGSVRGGFDRTPVQRSRRGTPLHMSQRSSPMEF